MQTITPFLWFNDQAEEAARYYVSIFPDSAVQHVTRYGEGAPVPKGTVMTVVFRINGQTFTALNGGPHFTFNPAVSFVVSCDSQQEIDHYWERLAAGGDPSAQQCGWLKDRFGLSWQVVPEKMGEWMSDPEKGARVAAAFMPMKRLDLATLEKAAAGS